MNRPPAMVRIEIRVPPDDAARWAALPNTAAAREVIRRGLDALEAKKCRAR